ncbi:MAG: phage virion morphogenesis protein, partial [Phenylobacterium sp.]|nr:phage virion morphogenesis protein [Phenylobacterium sp.]
SLSLRFSFDGARARQAYGEAAARGRDLRPALRAVGAAGVAQTKRRFVTKRAPDGSAWKPTFKIGGSTMIQSGLLLRSIAAQPPSQTAVEWGSNRIYAAMRQTGGTIRAKDGGMLRFRVGGNGGWVAKREVTQHARPYLGLNGEDEAAFEAILLRHLGSPLVGGPSVEGGV